MGWWRYEIVHEQRPDGRHVALRGAEVVWSSGPHATHDAAEGALLAQLRRWCARAKALGGMVQRTRADEVSVELPDGVTPPRGALVPEHRPMSRAPRTG